MNNKNPSLFGITNSNRDFTSRDTWGKNQFNSSFPASLACYMHSTGIEPVYLTLGNDLKIQHKKIGVTEFFGINPLASDTFYAFETPYSPFENLVSESLPRIDLVTCKIVNGLITEHLRGIEIKLTALPDHPTAEESEDSYGCEIVVRPDTIVYLALNLALSYLSERETLLSQLKPLNDAISDWQLTSDVYPNLEKAVNILDQILLTKIETQKPFLLQPIWKTDGKTLVLKDQCLDSFVWSDFALTRLFVDVTRKGLSRAYITRHARTVIWVLKMMLEFAEKGQINHRKIIDELTYGVKNDKAFAVSGKITRKYMHTAELKSPRITKDEIKKIILGGGEKLLSPERRFDAAIIGTKGLFTSTGENKKETQNN
jgi:HindVP restriction endonuclease